MPHFTAASVVRKASLAGGKVRPTLRTMNIERQKFFPSIGRDHDRPAGLASMAVEGSRATPNRAFTMPTAVDI